MSAGITHGTESGYSYHGCRCDTCRTERTRRVRERRQRIRAAKPAPKIKPIEHGTAAGYGRGCRCEPCREARRAYTAAWKLRTGRTAPQPATSPASAPASDITALLESRSRALALTIATAPRSTAAFEARHRRAEVLELLARLREVTA